MRKTPLITALLTLSLLGGDVSLAGSATMTSLQEPEISGLLVSHQGLFHLTPGQPAADWQALTGEHTFDPVQADGRAYITSSRGIFAYQMSNGEGIWHFPTEGSAFTPTLGKTAIYIATEQGELLALKGSSGDQIWAISLDGWIYPPVLMDGTLITGGSQGILWGIEAATGRILWQTELTQELVYRPIAVEQGRIAVTTFDGRLHLLNPHGKILWQQHFPSVALNLASDGDHIYVHELNGNLHALSLRDGQHLWQQTFSNRPATGITISNDRLFTTFENGRVYQLDQSDGRIRQTAFAQGEPISPVILKNGQAMIITQQQNKPMTQFLSFVFYDTSKGEKP